MTLPQPSTLPKWAALDQIDPVSNQNNVLTPPDPLQLYGWPRGEFPPRNWFNWLGRYTYEWLAYLKQNDSLSQTTVFQGTYGVLTPAICNTAIASICKLYIVDVTGGHASDSFEGNFTPSTVTSRAVNVMANITAGLPAAPVIAVSTVDKTTGKITVSNSDGGTTTFQLVCVQYALGV